MNCIQTCEPGVTETRNDCVVTMPLGLLGFEDFKRFTLVTRPGEEPFLWLQVIGPAQVSFLVLSPFVAVPGYEPNISEDDIRFLGIKDPKETLIFNIVTLRGGENATINLKGPIVLNRRTLQAKQVIPVNAADFSVAHPLPVQAS
jgi:flagellar assembly factor FliW